MQGVISSPSQTEVKALVDTHLRRYCAERIRQAETVGARYVILWQSIENLLLAGGKRFRPYMLMMSCLAYDPEIDVEDIMPAALAQELLHAAMLIHDDIIDRDLIRYGVKNIAGQYESRYKVLTHDKENVTHLARSAAVLAGDALLSDAHHLLRTTNRPDEFVRRAGDIFSDGILEVIGGELLDTEAAILPPASIDPEKVALHKTASYSFLSPLTMGGVLAGATMSEIQLLRQLSYAVGIGYQLRDDLLGVFGDSSMTGKSDSTDIREGKRTYLIAQFETLATDEQKTEFFAIFRRDDATTDEIERARALLVQSGARQKVTERITTLHQQADRTIESLAIDDTARQKFYDLVTHCLERES